MVPDHRRLTDGDVQIAGLELNDRGQQFIDQDVRSPRNLLVTSVQPGDGGRSERLTAIDARTRSTERRSGHACRLRPDYCTPSDDSSPSGIIRLVPLATKRRRIATREVRTLIVNRSGRRSVITLGSRHAAR